MFNIYKKSLIYNGFINFRSSNLQKDAQHSQAIRSCSGFTKRAIAHSIPMHQM